MVSDGGCLNSELSVVHLKKTCTVIPIIAASGF